jgi:alpha-ketoglutarate-dependent taurine dioxygenase
LCLEEKTMEDVITEPFDSEKGFPLVVRPAAGKADVGALISWCRDHREELETAILRHGAVLFRGYGADNLDALVDFRSALVGEALDYVDGNSPRTKLDRKVYTTTEYPADQEISMHNELSYSAKWPERLYLCCVTPPETGGETPVADCRRIVDALRPETARAFTEQRVCYVRNLHDGVGLGPSWQATFETESREEVEAFCTAGKIDFRWKDDGGLWLSQLGHGITKHPKTGESIWFNQVDQFHPTNLPPEVCEYLTFEFEGRENELPMWSCFEDGTPISSEIYDEIRRVNRAESVYAPWESGDLMIVDNMLCMHGRNHYTGSRKILVTMF